MLIDVVRPESWDELNDHVKSILSLSAKNRARCFHGMAQAVFEISQATAHFMSHKKSVGFVLGQTPYFEGLLPYYYKETYEVQKESHLNLQDVKTWVEQLKKDTNFVLFAEDHPVTGEKYGFAEELDKLLNEKRIFSFRVSHSQHLFENGEVRPYSVRLCSFGPHAAVAVTGERFRAPSLMAHTMDWDGDEFTKKITASRDGRNEDPASVIDFEKAMGPHAAAFFTATTLRQYDRAVIVFRDASADAIADLLFQKLNLTPAQGWQNVATTNMCHWSAVKMFRHWWQPPPGDEDLRGMLIVSTHLLKTKDFAKLLITSYEEVKAQQSWDV